MKFLIPRLGSAVALLGGLVSCQAPDGLAFPAHEAQGAWSFHLPAMTELDWNRKESDGTSETSFNAEATASGFGFQYEKFMGNGLSYYGAIDSRDYSVQHADVPGHGDGWEYRLGSRMRFGENYQGWRQFFLGGHTLFGSGLTRIVSDSETGESTSSYWGLGVECGANWFISPMVSFETVLMYEYHLGETSYITANSATEREEGLNGLTAQIGLAVYY